MSESPAFNYGIDFANLSIYGRNLPHWRQEGAVYFVTFRLADSIPRSVAEAWQFDRKLWLKAHGIEDHFSPAEKRRRLALIPTLTRQAFERDQARQLFIELDSCHGTCHLQNVDVAKIVSDALHHFSGERLYCGDFVVMPNHVHWLVVPQAGYKLEAILHSIKRYTARKINDRLSRSGALWQKESFDHIVRNADEFERTRTYIRDNLSKANLRANDSRYFGAEW